MICQVEGGEGQFAGSEGLITSNFFLSDTGEVTENHFGLIFVHDRQSTDDRGADVAVKRGASIVTSKGER